MLSKRSSCASIAACSFCAVFAASVYASNSSSSKTISVTPPASHLAKADKDRRPDQNRVTAKDRKAIQLAKAEKARQADLKAQRRIVTYNLFHDPVFKLDGAIADKRQFITPSRLVAKHGYPVSGNPVPATASKPAAALNLDQVSNADLAFGCRERPFSTPSMKRELSACFSQQLDKSWKTQTYVTKGYTEGTQTWGGGLAFGYHY